MIPPSGDRSLVLTSKEFHMDEARENLSLSREYSKYMANWHSVYINYIYKCTYYQNPTLSEYNHEMLIKLSAFDWSFSLLFLFILQGPQGPPGPAGSQGHTGPPVSAKTYKSWHTHPYVWSLCHRMKAHIPFVSSWRVCLVKLDFQANPESLESLWDGLLFSNRNTLYCKWYFESSVFSLSSVHVSKCQPFVIYLQRVFLEKMVWTVFLEMTAQWWMWPLKWIFLVSLFLFLFLFLPSMFTVNKSSR